MKDTLLDQSPPEQLDAKAGSSAAPCSAFPPVLDACCGSRMLWFDRDNPNAIFMDKREVDETLCDGRALKVSPDIVADFTKMPFPDETFSLVVFDPPHLTSLGENSWLAKKYGRLVGDWEIEIAEGFKECLRVLKQDGTLIFKWNTTDVTLERVLALAPCRPLFGHTTGRQAKTIWAAFLKREKDHPKMGAADRAALQRGQLQMPPACRPMSK